MTPKEPLPQEEGDMRRYIVFRFTDHATGSVRDAMASFDNPQEALAFAVSLDDGPRGWAICEVLDAKTLQQVDSAP